MEVYPSSIGQFSSVQTTSKFKNNAEMTFKSVVPYLGQEGTKKSLEGGEEGGDQLCHLVVAHLHREKKRFDYEVPHTSKRGHQPY